MGFYQTQSCVSRPVRAASPVRKKTADTPVFRNNQLENRLIGAETLSTLPSSVPRVKLEFAYDYMSRRVSKKVYKYESEIWNLQSEMRFAYDGWNLIRENSTTPIPPYSVTNSYVWGLDLSGSLQGAGGIGGLLAARLGTNNVCYTYDANGNVSELLQSTAYGPQSILAHYEYSPFGETIVATGPLAKDNPFRFSTKYTDDESGLLYYGYRFYSPSVGRWLSRDPMEEAGGWNLYAFVGNASINKWDILGMLWGLTCDDKLSCSKDCKWTGAKSANRITGNRPDWWLHQVGKLGDYGIPGIPKYPPLQAHWDGVCDMLSWLEKVKTVSKPTPGSSGVSMVGNGGVMTVESRWWIPKWVPFADGYGGDDAGAMSASQGDFCCCSSLIVFAP